MAIDVPASGLPVEDCVPAVRRALAEAGQAVLVAPPGAGKTTILPLRLADERWLDGRLILVLEPRRLATRAAARRMASLLGEEVGTTVGFTTRDERRVGRATRVEVVTEGILTRRLQTDPSLPGVGLVVFDELHERSLHADVALAFLLDARSGLRPDLRLLAMSATMESAKVAALIGNAPVIESRGRAHDVVVRWSARGPRDPLDAAVTSAIRRALHEETGDMLVFLPGAADIRRVQARLTDSPLPRDVVVAPLFGALSPAAQDAALAPSVPGRRRVVLATDIAETSLTVAGVRVVIDSGQARTPVFDARSGLTKLVTRPISRASAEQRSGRAGRLGPGVAYRLWSEREHATRRPYPDPEISTVDLTGLALELAIWGAEAGELGFLDPPPARALDEARSLLTTLGAIDTTGRPTSVGRAMAELPVHPRLARMVIGAAEAGAGWTGCILAALLEDRDVLGGRLHEVPVDVAERVSLIANPAAHHHLAVPGAARAAARRAEELARRAGVRTAVVDTGRCGPILAMAYPDRLAQARGDSRFRLRTGAGACVSPGDPLGGEAFLVVADIDVGAERAGHGDGRIRLAAGLDAADMEAASAGAQESVTVVWDTRRQDVRARSERRLGALVLTTTDVPAPPGPATTAALLEWVRSTHLGALHWTAKARALQRRAVFAGQALDLDRHRSEAGPGDGGARPARRGSRTERREDRTGLGTHRPETGDTRPDVDEGGAGPGEAWPALDDAALLASLDEWLAPLLAQATSRVDVEAVDVEAALRARLGRRLVGLLDRLAPPSLVLAGGRRIPLDYTGDRPVMAVRAQEVFGISTHPTVAGGRVPVVVRLLSPAGRPIQVTADLPGFWSGTWVTVRSEMAVRYPKHFWPADPLTARPPPRGR